MVVAGLVTGAKGLRKLSAQDRASERNWRTLQLLLENGVFLVMGFQVTDIIGQVGHTGLGVGAAIGLGLLCVLILGVVRVAFVVPVVLSLRREQRRSEAHVQRIQRFFEKYRDDEQFQQHPRAGKVTRVLRRRQADAQFSLQEGLGWRGGAVLAWSGMRGVVTLAAAQSLPTSSYRSANWCSRPWPWWTTRTCTGWTAPGSTRQWSRRPGSSASACPN